MSDNNIVLAVYDAHTGAEQAVEGAVVLGGVSVIGAELSSIGVPKDSVLEYDVALKTDRYLLIVHGTAAEAAEANEILEGRRPAKLHSHSPQDAAQQDRELVPVAT